MASNTKPYNVGGIMNYLSQITGNDSLLESARPFHQDTYVNPLKLIIHARDAEGNLTEHRFSEYSLSHEGVHTVSRFCKKSVYLKHDDKELFLEVVRPDIEALELNILVPQERRDTDYLSLFKAPISSATFISSIGGYFEWSGDKAVINKLDEPVMFAGIYHDKYNVLLPVSYFGREAEDKVKDHAWLSSRVAYAAKNLVLERNPWQAAVYGSPAFCGELGLDGESYKDDWKVFIKEGKLFVKFADMMNFHTFAFAVDVELGACFPTIQVTKDGFPIVSYLLPESSSAVVTRFFVTKNVNTVKEEKTIGHKSILIPNVRDLVLTELPSFGKSRTNVGVFYVGSTVNTVSVGEIRGDKLHYLDNEDAKIDLPYGMLLTQFGETYLPNIFGVRAVRISKGNYSMGVTVSMEKVRQQIDKLVSDPESSKDAIKSIADRKLSKTFGALMYHQRPVDEDLHNYSAYLRLEDLDSRIFN